MIDAKRISKEIQQCIMDFESTKISVQLIDEQNLCHLKGHFEGPENSPYEGGHFIVDIKLPPEYPFRPPQMKFDTKIFHPNISSQTGAICLDILKIDHWSPVLTLKTALLSVQSLLTSPVPEDPQDAQVAAVYLKSYDEFKATAQEWVKLYAKDPNAVDEEKVARLLEMGFDRSNIVEALKKANGEESRAVEILFGE